ncbi:MAG: hypothetical protein Q8S20_18685 [Sulfuritalea sp.]|nr:hypothetical protein [Sulfuritalea sp.]
MLITSKCPTRRNKAIPWKRKEIVPCDVEEESILEQALQPDESMAANPPAAAIEDASI